MMIKAVSASLSFGLTVAVGAGTIRHAVRRRWPKVAGNIAVTAIQQPVNIHYSADLVPCIHASTLEDGVAAQGFLHAQHRFFQMDLQRRGAAGRLSELVGDATVELDAFMRQLEIDSAVDRDWAALSEEARSVLKAYAAGVNDYLQTTARPIEYALLRGHPAEWSPHDSLRVMRAMQWEFANDWQKVLLRGQIEERVGKDLAEALYSTRAPHEAAREATGDGIPSHHVQDGPEGMGSNAWAVAGRHTKSGRALLCNDTHLAYGQPGTWFEASLYAPNYDCSGYSVPGVPGVVMGRNHDIAWGIASTRARVQDLVIEELTDESPPRVRRATDWVPVRKRTITIGSRSRVHERTVLATEHGPLIQPVDDTSPLPTVQTQNSVTDITRHLALVWHGLREPSRAMDAVLGMGRARSWDDFRSALRDWDAPVMTFVYADAAGNIGQQVAGRIPSRPADATGGTPIRPEQAEALTTTIPFDDLLHELNPDTGIIVSANADPGGSPSLAPEWCSPLRMIRITNLLRSRRDWTPHDMLTIQRDDVSLMAQHCLPYLRAAEPTTPGGRAGQNLLRAWNGSMSPGSAAAGFYGVAIRELVKLLLTDTLQEQITGRYLTREQQYTEFLCRVLGDPDNPWWPTEPSITIGAALDAAALWWTQTGGKNGA